jgi:hypothetical protein
MSWDEFLKSLETEAGKMVTIIVLLGFLIGVALILVLTNHPPQEVGREMLTGAISSLLGILYGYLKGKG